VPYNGDALAGNWMMTRADRPRVCLTLGTVLPRMAGEGVTELLRPLLAELAEHDVELVVATDDETATTLRTVSPAIAHAGRLPLWQVLQTCDGVIHHGGNGTALTALTAGIPQLVLPSFDDQLENADAITAAGAGVRIAHETTSAAAIAERCVEVIADPGFTSAAARVAEDIAAQPSPVDLVRTFERLVAAAARHDDVAA
jgi:UDP:flavonoid glycosyltransferase YjiC (YdhE family)